MIIRFYIYITSTSKNFGLNKMMPQFMLVPEHSIYLKNNFMTKIFHEIIQPLRSYNLLSFDYFLWEYVKSTYLVLLTSRFTWKSGSRLNCSNAILTYGRQMTKIFSKVKCYEAICQVKKTKSLSL